MADLKRLKVLYNIVLNEYLAQQLELSKTQVKKILDQKKVFVNQRRTWIASYQLKRGDLVEVSLEQQAKPQQVKPIYHDQYYLVVSKPAGLNTNGPGSLETLLQRQYNDQKICAVHRLDKETSGLVIFAKSREYFEKIKEIFKTKAIKKSYHALAQGRVSGNNFWIKKPIAGEFAETFVKVLASNQQVSYLELTIPTGKKHQIRIHLAGIGHPLLGEKEYQTGVLKDNLLKMISRQQLHAFGLEFAHPYTGQKIFLKDSDPADFKNLCKKFQLI